jgi:hypothetical protein
MLYSACMAKWIAAALAVTLIVAGSRPINPAAAATSMAALQNHEASKATEMSARRRTRHHTRYPYRPHYRPYYYDRPYYYAPAPFVPFNYGYPLLPGPRW